MNQSKRPFVVSLGLGLIVFTILGFHRGESEAYYVGAVFAIIAGLAIVIWNGKATKESLVVWCRVSDQKSARKAATIGACAAFFYAGLICIFAILEHRYSSLVDAFLFAFLGLMVRWKTSRIAAVTALALYVTERMSVGIDRGAGAALNWLVVAVFLALVFGVRGTLAYHGHADRLPCTSPRPPKSAVEASSK
jgi:hypothetical protein